MQWLPVYAFSFCRSTPSVVHLSYRSKCQFFVLFFSSAKFPFIAVFTSVTHMSPTFSSIYSPVSTFLMNYAWPSHPTQNLQLILPSKTFKIYRPTSSVSMTDHPRCFFLVFYCKLNVFSLLSDVAHIRISSLRVIKSL